MSHTVENAGRVVKQVVTQGSTIEAALEDQFEDVSAENVALIEGLVAEETK